MFIRIDPDREVIEIDTEMPELKITDFNYRYVLYSTGEGSGYFSLGGYSSTLQGEHYLKILDNTPLRDVVNRIRFIETKDAADNVIAFRA